MEDNQPPKTPQVVTIQSGNPLNYEMPERIVNTISSNNPKYMEINNVAIPYPNAPIPKMSYQEILGYGDVDQMLKTISKGVPMIDEEVMYKHECDHQSKIYLTIFFVGILMFLLVLVW